jgi:hypothetical protein
LKNPSLYNGLVEAHERIRKYFGSEAQPVLDLVKGFEGDDDVRLFVFIPTTLPPDEALDTLDELYEQWWLVRLSAVQPKSSIDVEYV